MLHIIEHSFIDSLKTVPFLFLTYLVMEALEHKAGDKTRRAIGRAGKWSPLLGGILGAVPQCGFSAAASSLYAGRIISMGTLMAVYLSTSDEMLPIMISAKAQPALIGKILLLKVLIAIAVGFFTDMLFREKSREGHHHIHEMCEQEHCHCEKGIFRSAFSHTVRITLFLLLITLGLNLILESGGEDVLAGVLRDHAILGPVVAGLVGLIPNCASSVLITQLYLEGTMSFGTMMAGLLVGAGVGVLVLCRMNHDRKENLKIIAWLYVTGIVTGILL